MVSRINKLTIEDNKDKREKRNELIQIVTRGLINLSIIISIVIIIGYLASYPESLKEFLSFLKDIFSDNKTYWAGIGGLVISNLATFKLYTQKNNAITKLEEALKNYLPQNNKNLLADIEELFKKYKK